MEPQRLNGAIPYMVAVVFITQVITLVSVLAIPTAPMELVCRGLFTSPNAIRCYEQ